MENNNDSQTSLSNGNFSLVTVSVGILVLFLVLVGGVYFWVSSKNPGQVVFPAGVNYLGPSAGGNQAVMPQYDYAKLLVSSDWLTYKGKVFKYDFQYPKTLAPLSFPNDQSDAVTFKANNLPAEQNLMLIVETISTRDKALVGKPEEYIRGYWKYFSGLKGLNSITPFENEKGLKGFKVSYDTKYKSVTGETIFFMIPNDADHLIYFSNIFPKEGEALYNRIVNTLEYK